MKKDQGNSQQQKLKDFEMCFSSEGKYYVDGNEIKIDYDDNEPIPIETLKKLEESTMSQLDAFYLRKRLHEIGNFINKCNLSNEVISNELIKKIQTVEDKIPEISLKIVHDVVNGKFIKVEGMFGELKQLLEETKEKNEAHIKIQNENFKSVHERIEYTINKTLFGWFKNQYESKPAKTFISIFIISFIVMLIFFQLFHFSINIEIWNVIKGMVGLG